MSTNEYGLDVSYFKAKIQRILNEVERYTPDELARECARMASTACSDVLLEKEFKNEPEFHDGSTSQKAFWHALEFCNDPEDRNIRKHWERYKEMIKEQAA
jgi:hypothetical protein